MRKFTKQHNNLKWLFPIAKNKKEAEKIFNYVEENAKILSEHACISDENKDLAIDCFMKGYSVALQLETSRLIEKRIKQLYCNLVGANIDKLLDDEKEWKKYFRFHKFEDTLLNIIYDKNYKNRKYLLNMLKNTAFDTEAPVKEQLKIK